MNNTQKQREQKLNERAETIGKKLIGEENRITRQIDSRTGGVLMKNEMKNEVDRLTEQVILLQNRLTLMKVALERCHDVAEAYGDGTASAEVAKHGFGRVKRVVNEALTATQN